jgi:hypothetical protein
VEKMKNLLRGSLLLIGISVPGLFGERPARDLKEQLHAQHFSGLLEGNVSFTTLGTIHCGGKNLGVIFYEWYESSPKGAAIHASYRVILMDSAKYIGSYVVADKPQIHSDKLLFPYDAYGNSISCGTNGVLPQKVLLNGEIIPLAK